MVSFVIVMANTTHSRFRLASYNSRGFNDSKKFYLKQLILACDIVYLQEHWLSESQVNDLSVLVDTHLAFGVSGFVNKQVLNGRPFGGCAILWHIIIALTPKMVETNSRRVCALLLEGDDIKLLCVLSLIHI